MNRWKQPDLNPSYWEGSDKNATALQLFIWSIIGIVYLFEHVPAWLNRISPQTFNLATQLVIFALVLSAGLFLYLFKSKKQYYYGVVETAFAAVSVWYACHQLNGKYLESQAWLPVGGAAYLIVRGLTNIYDGKARQKTTPTKIVNQ